MNEHPSFYALDRLRLGHAGEADRDHARACAQCAAHLHLLAAPVPVPPWLAGVQRRAPRSRRVLWSALSAAAAAAILLVALRPGRDQTREKGAPSIELFVKRGEEVFAWDGHRPVRAHDRLRLRVRGSGYGHVSVASLPAGAGPALVLYEGPLPGGAALLPLSFQVDDQGSAEHLSVILGRRPVPAALHAPPAGDEADETWRQMLVIDKESEPSGGVK
jgi:hypothetical protein